MLNEVLVLLYLNEAYVLRRTSNRNILGLFAGSKGIQYVWLDS